MRTVLLRLGTAGALGWPTVAALFAVQFAGSVISSRVDFTDRLAEFLILRFVTILVGSFVLGVGELLRRRLPQPFAAAATLAAMASAVGFETAAFDWGLQLLGFADESRLGSRMATASVGVFPALVVTALVVTSMREYSDRNAQLQGAAQQLSSMRLAATERIAAHRAGMQHRIDELVQAEFAAVLAVDGAQSTDQMKRLLDDVVRPLSHQIEHEFASVESSAVVIPSGHIAWPDVLHCALGRAPLRTGSLTLWLGVMIASFLIPNFGAPGALASLLSIVLIAGWSLATELAWPRIPDSAPSWARFTLAVLAGTILAAGIALLVRGVVGFSLLSVGRLTAWIVLCELLAWTIALLSAAFVLLRDTNAALSLTVAELKREVVELNTALRQHQRSVSRALHGPVQRALALSIRQLQQPEPAVAQGEMIRNRIATALQEVRDASSTPLDLRSSIADLIELWQGITVIEVEVSDADLDVIGAEPPAALALHELLNEACTNAMKHGEAKHIHARIVLTDAGRSALLTVDNDGSPLTDSTQTGLGSKLLNELSLSWRREQLDDTVRLEAVIPVGADGRSFEHETGS